MSFAVQQNNFWAAVLGLTFPSLLSALGPSGAFYLYAGTNLIGMSFHILSLLRLIPRPDNIAWMMCFLLQPETARRTLEELDFVYAVPMPVFIRYQTTTWLPWFVKRYIFWRKDAKLRPLYQLEGVGGEMPEKAH